MRAHQLSRRGFTRAALGGLGLAGCRTSAGPPNILWITSEDNGPFLGCYGDPNATTPHLDRLASEGVLYKNAFASYPVGAPAHCTLITGVHANSLGTGHVHSRSPLPETIRMFPALLREAGYYTTNRSKQDYNTPRLDGVWDQSDKDASYRNRQPGQPFFHVLNLTVSHESSLFNHHAPVHDPRAMAIPPYHPDTPVFRNDWAQYYDHVTRMDEQAGQALAELFDDGLSRDTIVFYFSDHGGVLPRSKRFVYDSGVRVPLIIRFPGQFQRLAPDEAGSRTERLVSFVDFAPTVLRLVGLTVPPYMQGSAFLGQQAGPPRDFVFLARDRIGSCPDLIRAARDDRYKYIRNYLPQLPASQYSADQSGIRSWSEIWRLHEAGSLNRAQRLMFEPRPPEELYDTVADPHEVNNLAGQAVFDEVLARLRDANQRHIEEIRDTGFVPEIEMHRLTEGSTPYEFAHDPKRYPLKRISRVVESALARDTVHLPMLAQYLTDENTVIQYWAAIGCRLLEKKAEPAHEALQAAMTDSPSDAVRMAAAEALSWIGENEGALALLTVYLKDERPWVRFTASSHLRWLGAKARPALPALEEATHDAEQYPALAAEHAIRGILK